jgi:hypothetical protein
VRSGKRACCNGDADARGVRIAARTRRARAHLDARRHSARDARAERASSVLLGKAARSVVDRVDLPHRAQQIVTKA